MEINLRQLEKKDASLMLEWMHDKDVTQYLKLDVSEPYKSVKISF